MKTNKNFFRGWRGPTVALAAILAAATVVSGMAGWEHDKWTRTLTNTSPEQGGVGPVSGATIRDANRFIDEPASWMGPSHRILRHDPTEVAGPISRQYGISAEAAVNLARIHNVCDMSRGTTGVNGWLSTPARQAEAQAILEFVEKNRTLPTNIPPWATEKGAEVYRCFPPYSSPRTIVLEGICRGASTFMVVFAIEGGIACYDLSQGTITKGDFAEKIQATLIKAGFVGAVVAVTPGGWVTIAGIAAYIAADYIVEYLHTEYSTRYTKIQDLKGIVPDSFLANLQPTMEDYAQGRVRTQAVTMEDYASEERRDR